MYKNLNIFVNVITLCYETIRFYSVSYMIENANLFTKIMRGDFIDKSKNKNVNKFFKNL